MATTKQAPTEMQPMSKAEVRERAARIAGDADRIARDAGRRSLAAVSRWTRAATGADYRAEVERCIDALAGTVLDQRAELAELHSRLRDLEGDDG